MGRSSRGDILYELSLVVMGIILALVTLDQVGAPQGEEQSHTYPGDFFADTYEYPPRGEGGAPLESGGAPGAWPHGGGVRIAEDARIIPTTWLNEEDRQRPCIDCHRDRF